MVRVIIEHQAKNPEDAEKVVDIIHEIRDEILKLPGYISGEMLVNAEDESNIIVISTWDHLEQWKEWENSEKCREIEGKEVPFLAKPLSHRYYQYHHLLFMHDGL